MDSGSILLFQNPKNHAAIEKYTITPQMSDKVVTKGALAVAGSIINLVKMKGNKRPIKLPIMTVTIIDRPTTAIICGALKLAIADRHRQPQ